MTNFEIYTYMKARKGGGSSEDSAVLDSLINRSITQISNDRVTAIGQYAFYHSMLTTANFPLVVETGIQAFGSCEELKTVNMPLLSNMGKSTFSSCPWLQAVILPSLTSIPDYAFYKCTRLTTINLPLVISIGEMVFYHCLGLTTINLPLVVSIGKDAFNGCSTLRKVILSKNQVVALDSTSAFYDTLIRLGTGYIYVPDELVENYKVATNWVLYADRIKGISELEE